MTEVIELCECEAAILVLRTDGTLYRFTPHLPEYGDIFLRVSRAKRIKRAVLNMVIPREKYKTGA